MLGRDGNGAITAPKGDSDDQHSSYLGFFHRYWRRPFGGWSSGCAQDRGPARATLRWLRCTAPATGCGKGCDVVGQGAGTPKGVQGIRPVSPGYVLGLVPTLLRHAHVERSWLSPLVFVSRDHRQPRSRVGGLNAGLRARAQ
jgi:hypothetical protein